MWWTRRGGRLPDRRLGEPCGSVGVVSPAARVFLGRTIHRTRIYYCASSAPSFWGTRRWMRRAGWTWGGPATLLQWGHLIGERYFDGPWVEGGAAAQSRFLRRNGMKGPLQRLLPSAGFDVERFDAVLGGAGGDGRGVRCGGAEAAADARDSNWRGVVTSERLSALRRRHDGPRFSRGGGGGR